MASPNNNFDDDEEQSFLQRHRGLFMFLGLVAFCGGFFAVYKMFLSHPGGSAQAPQERIVMLSLPPPLPPPPPPPPPKNLPPPPPQEKMMVQEHVDHVDKPPDKPPEPAANVSTGIKGDGQGTMGVGGGNGNGSIGGGNYGGGKWGYFASDVQSRISSALKENVHTKYASMRIQVRIWADNTGRIIRAQLVDSTGDPTMDNAIKNEVLTGLQLPEAPPADMPMPIVLRLTAQKSGGK